MTWLLNSTTKEVQDQIIQSEDVIMAWRILEERFAGSNVSRKFALEQEIAGLMQGEMDIGKYFNKLINLWHKLDAMKKSSICAMTENCQKCKETDKEKQEERVMKFLMGLNEANSLIRTHILALKELPSLNAVFDSVSQEETHRKITHSTVAEMSAMNAQGNNFSSVQNQLGQNSTWQGNGRGFGSYAQNSGNNGRGRQKPVCSHCHGLGHIKENCFKLIGYPNGRGNYNGGRGRGSGRGYVNATISSKTDYEWCTQQDLEGGNL